MMQAVSLITVTGTATGLPAPANGLAILDVNRETLGRYPGMYEQCRRAPSARRSGTAMLAASPSTIPRQRGRHPGGTSMKGNLASIHRPDERTVLVQSSKRAAGQIP